MVPGDPSPARAISDGCKRALAMASFTAAPMRWEASSGPFSGSVGTLSQERGRPVSSTTPTLIFVAPRSIPTKNGAWAS